MVPDLSLSDYLEIRGLAFEWAESYDTKDWDRLRKVLGPSVRLDFRQITGVLHESLSPDEFVAFVSDQKIIGDPRIKTQHLLGASRWSALDDGKVEVWYQARVAHQRYVAEDMAEVANKGHGYGANGQTYKKIDGSWKIVGINAKLYWSEYDLLGTLSPEGA